METKQVFAAYDHIGGGRGKHYRYCPMCGAALPDSVQGSARMQCARCGWIHYHNPAPGVVVLINDGKRVLLGKRGRNSFAPRRWCLPGGFVEHGEDFLTAAIREVREETGLDVEILSILSVVSNFLAASLHTLVVVLEARIAGGKSAPGDDIEELRWFPLDGPFPEMAFEADRHIIQRYYETGLEGAPVDPSYARPQLP